MATYEVKSRDLENRAGARAGVKTLSFGPFDAVNNVPASGALFICDQAYRLISMYAVWSIPSSSLNVSLEKLTGTTAPGSGDSMQASGFVTSGAANTVVNSVPSFIDANNEVAIGDRIGMNVLGVATGLSGLIITVHLLPLGDKLYWRSFVK